MELKKIFITVRNDLDVNSWTELGLAPLTSAERWKRAFKVLGITWGAALLCVLVPVLHFVLVPLFIVVGLALFYRQLSFRMLLDAGRLPCPACKTEFQTKQVAFNWPRYERCTHCQCELILSERRLV